MRMPTAQDVNANRKQRFAEQITTTIETEDLDFFRQIIQDYENEHDITAEDIAAALAVIAQQGRAFFLDEDEDIAHASRPFADDGDRPRKNKGKKQFNNEGMVDYKLNVGRSARVSASAIVGALANEGGIKGSQIGSIDIRQHFTIVGLPQDLPRDFLSVCATPKSPVSSLISARITAPGEAVPVAGAAVSAMTVAGMSAAAVVTVRVATAGMTVVAAAAGYKGGGHGGKRY